MGNALNLSDEQVISILRFYCNIDNHICSLKKAINKIAFTSFNKTCMDSIYEVLGLQINLANLEDLKEVLDSCKRGWNERENMLFNYKYKKSVDSSYMKTLGIDTQSRTYFHQQKRFEKRVSNQLYKRGIDKDSIRMYGSKFEEIEEYKNQALNQKSRYKGEKYETSYL